MHFYSAQLQNFNHPECGKIVRLVFSDDKGIGLISVLNFDTLFGHQIGVIKKILLVQPGCLDQAFRQNQFVVNYITQTPPATGPGIKEIHSFFKVFLRNFSRLNVNWRGHSDRGRLAQQADNIMQPGGIITGTNPPASVTPTVNHTFIAMLLQIIGHINAAEIDAPPEQGLDIGQRGIHKGGNKEASAIRAHLMFIYMNLRKPLMVEHAGDRSGFGQIQHEEIAVIIVAGIMMVKPGHIAPFVLCSEILTVPIDNHLLAIRIDRRTEKHNNIIEGFLYIEKALTGDKIISQLHSHLRGSYFGRMDVAGNKQNGLAFFRQLPGLA